MKLLVSRTNELNVALVRQQERHIHRGEKLELLPQPRIKRLLPWRGMITS